MVKFISVKQNFQFRKDLKNIVEMPLKKKMKKDHCMLQCVNME